MNPLLSVVVITYNHERFIEQALRSIFEQVTSFDYEVIIGVDASDDQTAAIAEAYATSYPRIIRLIKQPCRVGLFRNFASTYSQSKGRYVALLEGDDYWIAKEKLEQQVKLLSEHPSMSLCGHATLRVDVSGNHFGRIPDHDYTKVSSPEAFLLNYCDFHTSSLVFPEPFGRTLPPQLLDEKTRAFDLSLKYLLASHGDIGYLNQEMSAFRAVSGSASSSFERERKEWIKAMILSLENIRPLIPKEIRSMLDRNLGQLEWNYSREEGLSFLNKIAAIARSLRWDPSQTAVSLRNRAINLIKRSR